MPNDLPQLLRLTIGLLMLSAAEATAAERAAEEKVDPQVQALLDKHLRVDPSYSPGDILARDQVERIYNDLLARGLKPTLEAESSYSRILRTSSFLVQVLRTPEGKALMKKIGNQPLAYDRLDRLSWLPNGQAWIRQIVASPEGAELLERIFSDEGIEAMRKQYAADPQIQNLRLPTGKIYTEAALGRELTRVLREQLQSQAGSATNRKTAAKADRAATSASPAAADKN